MCARIHFSDCDDLRISKFVRAQHTHTIFSGAAVPSHVMQGACTLCILHFMCVDIINLLMAPPKNAEEKSARDLARNQCNGGFFPCRLPNQRSPFLFLFHSLAVRCPDSDMAAPQKRREQKKYRRFAAKNAPSDSFFRFRFYFSLDSLSRTVSSKCCSSYARPYVIQTYYTALLSFSNFPWRTHENMLMRKRTERRSKAQKWKKRKLKKRRKTENSNRRHRHAYMFLGTERFAHVFVSVCVHDWDESIIHVYDVRGR